MHFAVLFTGVSNTVPILDLSYDVDLNQDAMHYLTS